jgi:hypothetical protein
VGEGKIAPPFGIFGLRLCEAAGSGETVAIGFERVGERALGRKLVARIFIGDGETALRSGSIGVSFGGVLSVRAALRRIFCFVDRAAPILSRFNLGRLGLFGLGLIG